MPQHRPLDDELLIPYFVYGTLRPGGGNDWTWQRDGDGGWGRGYAASNGDAIVRGYSLWVGGLPFAIPSLREDAYVVGTLIYPEFKHRRDLREEFDRLEGHPHGWTRVMTTVYTPVWKKGREAWIYEWTHDPPENARWESSGDYMIARRAQMAGVL